MIQRELDGEKDGKDSTNNFFSMFGKNISSQKCTKFCNTPKTALLNISTHSETLTVVYTFD